MDGFKRRVEYMCILLATLIHAVITVISVLLKKKDEWGIVSKFELMGS